MRPSLQLDPGQPHACSLFITPVEDELLSLVLVKGQAQQDKLVYSTPGRPQPSSDLGPWGDAARRLDSTGDHLSLKLATHEPELPK